MSNTKNKKSQSQANKDKVVKENAEAAYQLKMAGLIKVTAINSIMYYVLPFICWMLTIATGSNFFVLGPMLIIYMACFAVFVECLMLTSNHGFSIVYPILCSIYFIPSIFIFHYQFEFIIFAGVYFVMGLFGCLTSKLMNRIKKKRPLGYKTLEKANKRRMAMQKDKDDIKLKSSTKKRVRKGKNAFKN